jgi:hypothetical protein
MEEGKGDGEEVTIPGLEAMWEEAPESNTQSDVLGGGVRATVLNALASEVSVQGDQVGGGVC